MEYNKTDRLDQLLFGLFLQVRDFYHIKDNDGVEQDLEMREKMLRITTERIEALYKKDDVCYNKDTGKIINFPSVPWSKL
jgi:hypothetical protein